MTSGRLLRATRGIWDYLGEILLVVLLSSTARKQHVFAERYTQGLYVCSLFFWVLGFLGSVWSYFTTQSSPKMDANLCKFMLVEKNTVF